MKYLLTLTTLAFIVLLHSCSSSGKKETGSKENKYIYGYTTGTIQSASSIEILLEENVTVFTPGDQPLPENILKFSPSVKGKLFLKTEKMLQFIPAENMKNGQEYEAVLNLGALLNVSGEDRAFTFKFNIVKLKALFTPGELTVHEDGSALTFSGTVYTSDYIDSKTLESNVKASYKDAEIALEWNHTGNSHHLSINNIAKEEYSDSLLLFFDKKLFAEERHKITIPGKNSFSVISAELYENSRSTVKINFSDNLDPQQDLNGLVTIQHVQNITYKINGNALFLYYQPGNSQTSLELMVHNRIRNTENRTLEAVFSKVINLPSNNPAIKFIGKGTVVSSKNNFIIPFSAVALKAVDVQIVKVFDQNMNFFLQSNNLEGSSFLIRCARPVFRKKIDLKKEDNFIDLNTWNDFTLDLSTLFKPEKGVIYRVEIRFRRSYTTLECAKEEDNANYFNQNWDEGSSYYYDDEYYNDYYYSSDYRWEERDNPCSNSYYNGNRFISKNIINTSLGILAKRAINNRYFIAINDILTATPVANCRVVLYNYQNQAIDSAETDKNGFAYIQAQTKAFTVVAKTGDDKAWLKVNDAGSLSLSNFDVSGEDVQQGVKGFIYGERGVWRPGDDIYLSFILENKLNVIPEGHPILAELIDPQGTVIQSKKSHTGQYSIHTFKFNTAADATTGYWKANVKVGGSVFSKSVRIEAIKPNRLSIDMTFPNEEMTGKGVSGQEINVTTRWLTGASTPNRKAITEVKLQKAGYTFKNFRDYTFMNPAVDFQPYSATLFDGQTDGEGRFSFNTGSIDVEKAPGVLSAVFTTRVFEESGDFSISTYATHYSPYERYVGIKLPESSDGWYSTQEAVTLSGAVVLPSGEAAPDGKETEVNVKIYKVNWRWWWDSGQDELGQYINRSYNQVVFDKHVKVRNGVFTTDIHAREYGRYFIEVTEKSSGHSSGLVAWFGSWAENTNNDMATLLNIDTDKKSYRAGEKIRISIPSSAGSTAIVSIENGMTFKEIYRVSTTKGNTLFEVEATGDMCPNAYISVTLIQPHAGRDNDRPVRMYGVVNVSVDDADLHLTPTIKAATEIRPSGKFEVTVGEKEGKEMDYTIAVVDEGLLSVTSFKTPAPFPAMYAREALGVKTWDFYDYLFGAYGARLERAFAIGGDETIEPRRDESSNRFKPVVLFKGPFHLGKGETQKHTFDMPEYIGEVRTTVVAAGKEGRYGAASAGTVVKQPLMLSAAMPRVFTPGDVIDIPVTVFAMDNSIEKVNVSLKADDRIEVIDKKTATLLFSEKGEKLAWFKIRIRETTGQSTLTFQATAGKEKSEVREAVEIRVPNPRITEFKTAALGAGEKAEFSSELNGADPVSMLEVASIPPLNLGERLEYLIRYPHGCAEQITSAAFPQVSLPHLLELKVEEKARVEANVKEVINRLSRYQTGSGGFAYWPGGSYESEWVSIYVTHFLISAGKLGYEVPDLMLRKAISYLRVNANGYRINSPYEEMNQAYQLYVLALAGRADAAAMNRMKERELKNNTAQWLLAGAYALTNHRDVAMNLIRNVPASVSPYRQTGGSYGSGLRDKSVILQAMIHLGMQEEAYRLLGEVSADLSSKQWLSTQSIAFSLLAVTDYVKRFVKEMDALKLTVTTSEGTKEVAVARTLHQEILPLSGGKSAVQVKNGSKATLYVRQINSYAPYGVSTKEIMSGLNMQVTYRNAEGAALSLNKLPQGTDITAEVSIKHTGTTGAYENLALSYLLPSGVEIINDRLAGNPSAYEGADHVDIRDDRFYLYFGLLQNERKTFRFRFNAAFSGNYLMPAIECSAMYDKSIEAVLPGGTVTIENELNTRE